MTKGLRVRAAEAVQRDAERGKVRIDDAMRFLKIVAGEVISIKRAS